MSRLTDKLQALEWDLAKYRDDDANALLNRRLILRKAFTAHGQECYDEGHRDGMRDASDTRHEAQRRPDEAEDGKENADG